MGADGCQRNDRNVQCRRTRHVHGHDEKERYASENTREERLRQFARLEGLRRQSCDARNGKDQDEQRYGKDIADLVPGHAIRQPMAKEEKVIRQHTVSSRLLMNLVKPGYRKQRDGERQMALEAVVLLGDVVLERKEDQGKRCEEEESERSKPGSPTFEDGGGIDQEEKRQQHRKDHDHEAIGVQCQDEGQEACKDHTRRPAVQRFAEGIHTQKHEERQRTVLDSPAREHDVPRADDQERQADEGCIFLEPSPEREEEERQGKQAADDGNKSSAETGEPKNGDDRDAEIRLQNVLARAPADEVDRQVVPPAVGSGVQQGVAFVGLGHLVLMQADGDGGELVEQQSEADEEQKHEGRGLDWRREAKADRGSFRG
jgi:hypothetical protein